MPLVQRKQNSSPRPSPNRNPLPRPSVYNDNDCLYRTLLLRNACRTPLNGGVEFCSAIVKAVWLTVPSQIFTIFLLLATEGAKDIPEFVFRSTLLESHVGDRGGTGWNDRHKGKGEDKGELTILVVGGVRMLLHCSNWAGIPW
jgi:hypothetical protein